jgi:hypothetical protein
MFDFGFTTTMLKERAISATGARSRSWSYDSFAYRLGLTALANVAHQQRVAVAFACRDRLRPDNGPCPRLVLDDHGRVEVFGHLLRQCPPHHVGAAAGRKRHHDLHDPLGIERRGGIDGERETHRACCKRERQRPAFEGWPGYHDGPEQ